MLFALLRCGRRSPIGQSQQASYTRSFSNFKFWKTKFPLISCAFFGLSVSLSVVQTGSFSGDGLKKFGSFQFVSTNLNSNNGFNLEVLSWKFWKRSCAWSCGENVYRQRLRPELRSSILLSGFREHHRSSASFGTANRFDSEKHQQKGSACEHQKVFE